MSAELIQCCLFANPYLNPCPFCPLQVAASEEHYFRFLERDGSSGRRGGVRHHSAGRRGNSGENSSSANSSRQVSNTGSETIPGYDGGMAAGPLLQEGEDSGMTVAPSPLSDYAAK